MIKLPFLSAALPVPALTSQDDLSVQQRIAVRRPDVRTAQPLAVWRLSGGPTIPKCYLANTHSKRLAPKLGEKMNLRIIILHARARNFYKTAASQCFDANLLLSVPAKELQQESRAVARSLILAPIESVYAISYWSSIVTLVLSCPVS